MDFSLRQACPEDLDRIMTLETLGFPPGIVEERAVFARRLSVFPEGFWVASSGALSWGYLCTEVWGPEVCDGDPFPRWRFDLGHDVAANLNCHGNTLYIASMTVDPVVRGRGWGAALFRAGLDRMVQQFPHLERALLIVNEHWTGARRIYTQEGFGEVQRLEAFFTPDGGPMGDAIVMAKEKPLLSN